MTHRLITTCSCTTKSKDTVFNQTKFIEQQSLSYKFLRESYFVSCMYKDKNRICWNKFSPLNVYMCFNLFTKLSDSAFNRILIRLAKGLNRFPCSQTLCGNWHMIYELYANEVFL